MPDDPLPRFLAGAAGATARYTGVLMLLHAASALNRAARHAGQLAARLSRHPSIGPLERCPDTPDQLARLWHDTLEDGTP